MDNQTGLVYVPPSEQEFRQREVLADSVHGLRLSEDDVLYQKFLLGDLIAAARKDSKILAIKAVRAILKLDLKEAKDLADKYWVDLPKSPLDLDLADALHKISSLKDELAHEKRTGEHLAQVVDSLKADLDAGDNEVAELQAKVNSYRRVLNDQLNHHERC